MAADPTPAPSPVARAWPHLRAALVILHVIAVLAAALPSPEGGMRKAAWKDPTVQDEFAAWTARLNGLGIDLRQEELEAHLWELAKDWTNGRDRALAPFRPYYRYAGTQQSWRMFVAPHRYPARLHIEVREAGAWRAVYIARDPEHDWLSDQLDHDRMRSAIFRYAWPQYRRTWRRFVGWTATEAAADFPEADALRMRYRKARTPTPAEVRSGREPEGRWIRSRTVSLPDGRFLRDEEGP